jgi:hypothetical protein
MKRSRLGFSVILGAMVASLVGGAAPAAATVTVGQITAPTNTCSTPVDRVQPTVTGGSSYVIPENGTITSWSTQTTTNGGQIKLKVFRPVAGMANTFSVVGQTDPQTLALNATNTFPASIAVKTGDLIGMNTFSGTPDCGTLVVGESYLRQPAATATPDTGDLANGQSATFGGVVMDRRLDISAELNPTNTLTFGQAALNKKKGTGTLTINAPNPGQLTSTDAGVTLAQAASVGKVIAAGPVTVNIKATGKKQSKLRKKGKVNVTATFTFTPNGGTPNTQSTQVKLKLKKKK